MKKSFVYTLLGILFFGITAFVVFRHKDRLTHKTVAFYPLQERKGLQAHSAEWASTKTTASKLIRMVRENPDHVKSALQLAALYIQEARITGEYLYYNTAAMKYVDDVLKKEPENVEALLLKSLLYLSQHHFAEGLATAQKAQKINPYQPFIYGILVDGHVEMGNYAEAVENCDKMVSMRPDIRSYSRVSYLREIHGDYPGAIEAMKMAADAGGYGDEPTAWAKIQLARLYENTGDLKSAAMYYTLALEERPGYAYAVAGLGSMAMGKNDYPQALSLLLQADSLIQDFSIKEKIAELYLLLHQPQKAQELLQRSVSVLSKEAEKGESDDNIGHYADSELAYAYLLIHEYSKALQHAQTEYSRRPDNIEVNEMMAWVYYKQEKYSQALPYLKQALKTNSKNPVLLCRAGLIYAKAGNNKEAKTILSEVLNYHPHISPLLKQECINELNRL